MITFTGTASERGKQHGSQFAQDIKDRVARLPSHDLDSKQRAHLAEPWLDATEDLDADLIREMSGIAAGSGLAVADIVLLNAFEAFKLRDLKEKGGCTVVGSSANGRAVIAQNWDANAERAEGLAVHRHRGPDTPDVAVLSSPGGLGWIGMNEYGLALVNNDLVGGPIEPTVPSKAIRRVLLKQPDTASALAKVRNISHPAVRSYVIADARGSIVAIEVSAYEAPVVSLQPATVVHANHAVSSTVRAVEDRALQESVFPSSAHRADRAAELLAESPSAGSEGHSSVVGLMQVLRDHDGFPLSICRHPHPSEVTHTVASAVFDCGKRRAKFSFGLACQPHTRETVDFGLTGTVARGLDEHAARSQ